MPVLPNIFGQQPFIQSPDDQAPSPDALVAALNGPMPTLAPMPMPAAEQRRRNNLVNALAPPAQSMTSPWQVIGSTINSAGDEYLRRQQQDAQQQAQAQAVAQQGGTQGPVQPADAIAGQNKLIPDFDLSSLFSSWGS